jgi:hypothetical protein
LRTIENFLQGLREQDCIRIISTSNHFVLYFDADLPRDRFHGIKMEVERTVRVMGHHTVNLMTNGPVAGYGHLTCGALQGRGIINNLQLELEEGEVLINNYSKIWDRICAILRLR